MTGGVIYAPAAQHTSHKEVKSAGKRGRGKRVTELALVWWPVRRTLMSRLFGSADATADAGTPMSRRGGQNG